MSTTTRRAVTDDEREQRREQERELVARAVAELESSEGWQQWLTTRSRFAKYSFSNQLLVAIQSPGARHVAGFKKWLELGYCVKRGEHAIRIWAPVPPSKARLAAYENARQAASRSAGTQLDGEAPRTFFRMVAVFSQDQVEPLPPPAVPAVLDCPIRDVEGEDLAERIPNLVALAASIGSAVSFEEINGGAHGCYIPTDKRIVIAEHLTGNGKVKTLIHELGHALLRADRQDDDPTLDYAGEELIVESVAMSVAGVLGLSTSGYSIPYLASWSRREDLDIVEKCAKLVNRLANRLEDALEVSS